MWLCKWLCLFMYIFMKIHVLLFWNCYSIKKNLLFNTSKNRNPNLKFNKRVKWRENVSHVAIYLWSLKRRGEKITCFFFQTSQWYLFIHWNRKCNPELGFFPDKPFQTYIFLITFPLSNPPLFLFVSTLFFLTAIFSFIFWYLKWKKK